MAVQADLGDRAGAVSTYHRCASVLERELGVVPDEATRATLQRVMAPAPGDRPGRSNGSGPAARGRPGALVGRAGRAHCCPDVAGRRGRAPGRGRRPRRCRRRQDPPRGRARRLARQSGALVAASQCFGTAGGSRSPGGGLAAQPRVQSATRSLDPVWRARGRPAGPGRHGPGAPASGTRAMVDAWQRHRFLEGLARASSASAGRRCWSWTTCSGATRRPWRSSPSSSALRPAPRSCWPRRCAPTTGRRPHAGGLARADARHRQAHRGAAGAARGRRHRTAGRGHPRPPAPRRRPQPAAGRRRAASRCTSSRRCAPPAGRAPLPAGDLEAVLRRRLDQVSAPLVSWPAWPPRSGATSPSTCWWRPATSTPTASCTPSTSCGGCGSCTSAATATTSPTTCSGGGVRAGQPTAAVAAAPTPRPGAGAAARRRHRTGVGPAGGAVRPRRTARTCRRVLPPRCRCRVRPLRPRRRDPAALRGAGHRAARSPRARPRPAGARRPRGDGGAAQRPARLLLPRLQAVLERSVELAESLGRDDSLLIGLVGLWASRFVQGHIADAHRTAVRALRLVHPSPTSAARPTSRVPGRPSASGAGGGAAPLRPAARLATDASLSVGTRPDIHGQAWSAHAHWLLGDDARPCPAARTPSPQPAPSTILQPGGGTGVRRHHPPAAWRPRRAASVVTELRNLCDRYGFAYYCEWALVLQGWLRRARRGSP